jgi:hypothetical protein
MKRLHLNHFLLPRATMDEMEDLVSQTLPNAQSRQPERNNFGYID